MEPAINADLTHNVKAPYDLTFEFLLDIGWDVPRRRFRRRGRRRGLQPELEPRANDRDRRGIDSGVENHLFPTGCTSADLIANLAAASTNHGSFVSGIADLTNEWKADGLISGREKGAIQSAAARSN